MAPNTPCLKEPHDHVHYTFDTIKCSLGNAAYVLNNSSAHNPKNPLTVLSTTKISLIRKYNKPITTWHIKDVIVVQCHKYACFESLYTSVFSSWNQM